MRKIISLLLVLVLCLGLAVPALASSYTTTTASIGLPGISGATLKLENVYPCFNYMKRIESAAEYTIYCLEKTSALTFNVPVTLEYMSKTEWEYTASGQYIPATKRVTYAAGKRIALNFNDSYGNRFTINLSSTGSNAMNPIEDDKFHYDEAVTIGANYGMVMQFVLASDHYEDNPIELRDEWVGGDAQGNLFYEPRPLLSDLAVRNPKPSAWAAGQIEDAVKLGLVPENLQYNYTTATTRAEFCALAVALYETVTGKEITARASFSDTTDVNVQKMAALGVVAGVGDGKFAPDRKLTREQAGMVLAQLASALGKPLAENTASFADNAKISSWASKAVGQVQGAGIMSGTSNNNFSPKNDYTREQSISTILRMYDLLNK